jgi:hypothetical protein
MIGHTNRLFTVLRPAQEFLHRDFEQEGIFIVSHLLLHVATVFLVSSKDCPHSVAFYDTQGDVEDLF